MKAHQYPLQRLLVAVQRGNAISVMGSMGGPTFFLFSVSISVQCLFYVLCSPPFMLSLFFKNPVMHRDDSDL